MIKHPAVIAYETAQWALYRVEREIETKGRPWAHAVDLRILPSLEAKRDRMQAQLIDLKIAADAVPVQDQRLFVASSDIKFAERLYVPAGTLPDYSSAAFAHLDMPACLRRAR